MYAIAKQAGVPQSMLIRFMAGKSIGLKTAEKLGVVLGFDLVDLAASHDERGGI
jgi:hypothetical protein